MKNLNEKLDICIITTGGTIEKTYDEAKGTLENRGSNVKDLLLKHLRLPYTYIHVYSIFSKDSMLMTDDDRNLLVAAIKNQLPSKRPILILHGTDTMDASAEYAKEHLGDVEVPIIFTGAMKPLEVLGTDAGQNVTEALLASRFLGPGFYISFHNRIYNVPGVRKNKEKGTFEGC